MRTPSAPTTRLWLGMVSVMFREPSGLRKDPGPNRQLEQLRVRHSHQSHEGPTSLPSLVIEAGSIGIELDFSESPAHHAHPFSSWPKHTDHASRVADRKLHMALVVDPTARKCPRAFDEAAANRVI